MYILGLNGPPRCGKDSLAQLILNSERITIPTKIEHLSLPLREIAYAMVGRTYVHDDHEGYESFKNELFPAFDRSGRQLMIDVSEQFLKTTYGISVMSRMLMARNENFSGLMVIADTGFACEVGPIHDWCHQLPVERRGQGIDRTANDKFFVGRIHRGNLNFNNDSREWVYATHDEDYYNDGTLDQLPVLANQILDDVERLGWSL